MNLQKLFLLTTLFILTYTTLHAQTQDYAEITFVTNTTPAFRKIPIKLYLNDRLIAPYTADELVKYKIYSKGRISVTFSESIGNFHGSIDIKENKHYYCVVAKAFKGVTNGEISELDAKALISTFNYVRTVEVEEDRQRPIGKIPASTTDGGSKAGQGTGFLLSDKGYIVTNFHVVDGAKTITVKGINGEYSTSFEASIVCLDYANDLAILKLNTTLITFPTPPYSIQTSKEVKQGENVVALGYPIKEIMGSELKVTNGIINAKSGYKGSVSQFQFSAAVQPGNSGGPLINSKGDIIGVVSSKLNPQMVESAGYAIKSDYLSFFITQSEKVDYTPTVNTINSADLSVQLEKISKFIYIIETK